MRSLESQTTKDVRAIRRIEINLTPVSEVLVPALNHQLSFALHVSTRH